MSFTYDISASIATTSDTEYEAPEGLEYEDYQKACIDYCMERNDVLIADPPGLGKTIEALGVVNETEGLRILIICPANLKGNWLKEYEKWAMHDRSVCVAYGNTCDYEADVVIINYDILDRHIGGLNVIHWDVLILDEAHMLKNPKAKRTKYVFGGKIKRKRYWPIQASKRLALTGTPMLSRPVELWPILRAFDPGGLGHDYYKFVYRYCNAFKATYGLDVSGARKLDELQNIMRHRFMIRREKKILNLLPKRRQILELPKKGLSTLIEKEKAAVETNLQKYEEMLGIDLKTPEGLEEARELEGAYVEQAGELVPFRSTVLFEELSSARRDLALAKLPMVYDHVERLLESEHKLIVFIHHKEVAAHLAKRYGKAAVVITGDTSAKQTQKNVEDFQNEPDIRLMIGNIQSAGKGHTMTAASTVVFAELSWVPGELEQAEDRAWRYGQNDHVLVYHLVVEDSLDSMMVKKLIRKQEAIDKALNHNDTK